MDPIETVSSLCTVQNADPNIYDKYGKSVLHYAAQRGATISTMYLLKKGVDLHQKDIFGNTPLATALLNKHHCKLFH
jgi:ankyrin repeat protein